MQSGRGLRERLRRCLLPALTAGALLAGAAADAGAMSCGNPWSRSGTPSALDALYVLRDSLKPGVCPACECDADHDGKVTADDASRILRASVELPASLSCPSCPRYNFVVFLTDDQRADTLWAMPEVQKLSADGLRFDQAYSSTGECCPFRASFLAGGFTPANTGVKDNSNLNGGTAHFRDLDTLATRLQKGGYATGFVGKYLHGYRPGYVPPGWTSFVANENGGELKDWSHLAEITYGSSTDQPATGRIVPKVEQYITDFQRDAALDFLKAHADEPFFLYIAAYAPHWPIVPAPRDAEMFADYTPVNPAFQEEDLGDKPQWVQKSASPILRYPRCVGLARHVLQTLQSVDRMVSSVIEATRAAKVADRTYFLFASDNGTMWGEHRLNCDKGGPYEEALRVPLVAAGPGISEGTSTALVAVERDVPATILDLAGLDVAGDGLSLAPAMRGMPWTPHEDLLIENYGYLESPKLGDGSLWSGLRVNDESGNWTYVEYADGQTELYDLAGDPHEMNNVASAPRHASLVQSLKSRLAAQKGLALLTKALEPVTVGVPYRQRLEAWGGTPPRHWAVVEGRLPDGMTLDAATGVLSGKATTANIRNITVRVTDSGLGRQSLAPQEFSRRYKLEVKPAP